MAAAKLVIGMLDYGKVGKCGNRPPHRPFPTGPLGTNRPVHETLCMGQIHTPKYVLPILAVFSRYESAIEWARTQASNIWGDVALASEVFSFTETDYYTAEMGGDLRKCFLAFERFVDPDVLPDFKVCSNSWEVEYRDTHDHSERRPLNLDPGYLTEAKLVLATTKDRDHRIYLSQGIYAEVTLSFVRGRWQHRPWTYPDYQRPEYHAFFDRCREYYRQRLREV